MNNIEIEKNIYEDIISHSKELSPIEACGYLVGSENIITKIFPMKNMDQSEDHFTFDPAEQFNVLKMTREQNLSILSVYHSHPISAPVLSQEDLRLLNDPKMVYIIVSLENNETNVKGYRITRNGSTAEINEVKLNIINK